MLTRQGLKRHLPVSTSGGWQKTLPYRALAFPPLPEKSTIYFVDVPGAKQSVINIGTLALTRDNPDFYKAEVANYMLGGTASAQLFMILREEKGFHLRCIFRF